MKGLLAAVLAGFVLAAGAITLGAKWLGAERADRRAITVWGESRLTGEPDLARIMLGARKSGNTVAEAQKRLSETIVQVIAAVQRTGVEKQDIATSELHIGQGWDYQKDVPRGYDVSTTLTITVPLPYRGVGVPGDELDAAVAAGLNRLMGVSYDVRDPRLAGPRRLAVAPATADARKKAEAMAAGVGRPLGRILSQPAHRSVREAGEWQRSPAEEYYGAGGHPSARYAKAPPAPPPRLRALPGQRAMTVQVLVTYEL